MLNRRICTGLLTLSFSLVSVALHAQAPGADTYKAKGQSRHGATGIPSPALAKMLGIKPVSDPDIKKLTADQMFAAVKNGKGKMKPITGLTDAQIKDTVAFYRDLK